MKNCDSFTRDELLGTREVIVGLINLSEEICYRLATLCDYGPRISKKIYQYAHPTITNIEVAESLALGDGINPDFSDSIRIINEYLTITMLYCKEIEKGLDKVFEYCKLNQKIPFNDIMLLPYKELEESRLLISVCEEKCCDTNNLLNSSLDYLERLLSLFDERNSSHYMGLILKGEEILSNELADDPGLRQKVVGPGVQEIAWDIAELTKRLSHIIGDMSRATYLLGVFGTVLGHCLSASEYMVLSEASTDSVSFDMS